MSRTKKILIGAGVVVAAAAIVVVNLRFRRAQGPAVNVEAVRTRDLDAVVSASGKIQPKRSVNISADTMGRVTNLAVNEGDRVGLGQFLLQIDPKSLQSRVQSGEASVQAARSTVEQLRLAAQGARTNLAQAQDNLKRQRELWTQLLTTREALDRAENDVKLREAEVKERDQQIATQELRIQQERASLDSVRYDLSKVRLVSPIDGIVTRRNIEEGETVVVGTMNNAGTVLLTIADMSVIEAEVEVDETDIPEIAFGQPANVTIDAIADKTFAGKVTEIGNSPIQGTGTAAAGTARTATNFKVVVTLDGSVPDVRPGFTCTADVTTARRAKVVSVPIQAMTAREVILDANGQIVREPLRDRRRGRTVEPSVSAAELKPGQTRKELEGVFVLREGRAVFVAVRTGIAGDKYFEVLSGLKEGDRVIVGPFNSVRELADGDAVREEKAATRPRP